MPPARPGCPGAVPVCEAAVPSAVPSAVLSAAWAAAPGCPEHGTQIHVLPVSLRGACDRIEETLQERIHGKFNILKINYIAFQVEESRGFLFRL